MDQKATVDFFPNPGTLIIRGELLPHQPQVHDLLAAFLDTPWFSRVEVTNDRNILSYELILEATGLPSAADLDAVVVEAEVKDQTTAQAAAEALKS